ncbi:MAG: YcfL family protein [Verrucomicrobiota bacterium]|jgi:uncharacterized protein YcfL
MKTTAPLLFVLLAAAGCAAPVTKTETAPPPPAARQAAGDKRVLTDPSLDRAIHVVKVQTAAGAEGFLKIQVDVENRSDAPRRFSYSIEWLDGDGGPLPLASNGFLDWMLRAHESSSIAATAPTPVAKDFRITFAGPAQ